MILITKSVDCSIMFLPPDFIISKHMNDTYDWQAVIFGQAIGGGSKLCCKSMDGAFGYVQPSYNLYDINITFMDVYGHSIIVLIYG